MSDFRIGTIIFAFIIIFVWLKTPVQCGAADNSGTILHTLSSAPIGFTGINTGTLLEFYFDKNYVSGPDGSGNVIDLTTGKEIAHKTSYLLSANLFFTYGLLKYVDISTGLPIYYDVTGWEKTKAGIGDIECGVKFSHPHEKRAVFFSNAYYFGIMFPTGNKDDRYFPRHVYYQIGETQNNILYNPMLLWSLDFTALDRGFPFEIHGNLGGVITRKKNKSTLVGRIATAYTPIDLLTVFFEIRGESRVQWYTHSFSISSFENDPFVLTPGLRVNFPTGLYASLSCDIGLSSEKPQYKTTWIQNNYQYSTAPVPGFGVQVLVGWSGIVKEPDTDGDGIIDKRDKCPDRAEDKDRFEDSDGCPDLDNDGDGIADSRDACPNEKAVCDGCPVYDTDNDGIADDIDQCPRQVEDKDGYADDDGCPDNDNDNDRFVDAVDECPNEAEDFDGFKDQDGCPDLDNDEDGVPDVADACPQRKGKAENNGCPKTKEISRSKLILQGVNFRPNRAELTEDSYIILDQVYASLADWPEVRLEIQGHTDSQGSAGANRRLSQLRAETVRLYLIKKGIDPSRLHAVGYGEELPIADNTTAAGRALNRRVELKRID